MTSLWKRNKRYRRIGIHPYFPNPDGSDYHLMNAIDDDLREEEILGEGLWQIFRFLLLLFCIGALLATVALMVSGNDWA